MTTQRVERRHLRGLLGSPTRRAGVPSLDGFRAIAVLAIFLRHSWGLSGSVHPRLRIGGATVDAAPVVLMLSNGVDLFFVLSGFLLARRFIEADLLGRPRPGLRRYFRARWFRIVPAYLVVLGLFLLFFVPGELSPSLVYSRHGLATLAAHLTFLQTLFPWSYGLWSAESPLWTLTIEVLFYISVPWWSRLFFRNRWRWALPMALAITVGWLAFARSGLATPLVDAIVRHGGRPGAGTTFARYYLSKQFPAHAFDFACGMTAANWYSQWRAGRRPVVVRLLRSAPGAAALTAVASGGLLTAMWRLGAWGLRFNYYYGLPVIDAHRASAYAYYYLEETSMAVPFALLIAVAVVREGRLSRMLSGRMLGTVGLLGYSIYLWHMPLLYRLSQLPFMTRIPIGRRWVITVLFCGAVTGLLSLATYLWVERPCIARGQRPARSVRDDTPVAAGVAPRERPDVTHPAASQVA